MTDNKVFRFDEFILQAAEHRLLKVGEEIYIRPKTLELLLYLIKKSGHLVSKEELLENIWPGIIVSESSLSQCIKEIRKILNDDPGDPRYLKTVYRVGYVFIGNVKDITSTYKDPILEKNNSIYKTSFNEKTELQKKYLFQRIRSFKKRYLILFFVAFVLILWNLFYHHKTITFNERDWVLITDFANNTSEKNLGLALKTGLEIELSRSAFVNVVPQGRIIDILHLMRVNPETKINDKLGKEICLRDGNIQIMISGSIYKIGKNYSLSLEIIDPVKNAIIKMFSQEADGQQEVLPAINKLAISIRKELGESVEHLAKDKNSFERVTTHSIKALKFYSKGMYYINLFDFDRAQFFLNQAVQYDTNFAMCYVMLGFSNLWHGNLSEGKVNFKKASQLAANFPDREKFFILASNEVNNIGDYKKGIEYYQLLLNLYPDDYWGNENLSQAYLLNGDFKQSKKYKNICAKLRPNYVVNHSDLGVNALFLDGDINKAYQEFSRVNELNPNYPFEFPHLADAFLNWMQGDLDSANVQIEDFLSSRINKLLPTFQITSRLFVSHYFIFIGKFDDALELLEESVTLSNQRPKQNLIPWTRLELALFYWEMGQVENFESMMKSAAASSVGIAQVQALGWLAIQYARSGKINTAKKLLNELRKEDRVMPVGIIQQPLKSELARAKKAFGNQIEGEIAFVNGNTNQAIKYCNKVIKLVPKSYLPELTALNPRIRWVALRSLALIYEKMGNWDSAIAAYQKIINEKILVITVPAASNIWVKTLLSISKAFEKKGDFSQAKTYRKKYKRLRLSER